MVDLYLLYSHMVFLLCQFVILWWCWLQLFSFMELLAHVHCLLKHMLSIFFSLMYDFSICYVFIDLKIFLPVFHICLCYLEFVPIMLHFFSSFKLLVWDQCVFWHLRYAFFFLLLLLMLRNFHSAMGWAQTRCAWPLDLGSRMLVGTCINLGMPSSTS